MPPTYQSTACGVWGPAGRHDLPVSAEQITIHYGEASETTGEPGADCF